MYTIEKHLCVQVLLAQKAEEMHREKQRQNIKDQGWKTRWGEA